MVYVGLFTTVVYANKKPHIQIDRVHDTHRERETHIRVYARESRTVDRVKNDAKFVISFYSGDKCKSTCTRPHATCHITAAAVALQLASQHSILNV